MAVHQVEEVRDITWGMLGKDSRVGGTLIHRETGNRGSGTAQTQAWSGHCEHRVSSSLKWVEACWEAGQQSPFGET